MRYKSSRYFAIILIFLLATLCLVTACSKDKDTLMTPEITLTGKTVSWNAVENADCYKVNVNGVEYNAVNTSYSLSDFTDEGSYEVKVKAVNKNGDYLDSEYSTIVKYDILPNPIATLPRLPSPTGLRMVNSSLTFNEVYNAVGYSVYIDNEFYKSTTALSLTIDTLPDGKYNLTVIAMGGTSFRNSNASTPYTIEFADGKLVKLTLDAPNNLRLEGDTVKWDVVYNSKGGSAVGYFVRINAQDEIYTTDNFYQLTIDEPEAYTIKVRAAGDSTFASSDYSKSIEIPYYLTAPVGLINYSNYIKWDKVKYASSYRVNVNGTTVEVDTNSYFLTTPSDGTYTIKVLSVGDGIYYRDSLYSNEIYVVRANSNVSQRSLVTPEKVRIEKNIVKWDAVADASSYDISIDTIGSNNEVTNQVFNTQSTSYMLPVATKPYIIKVRAKGGNSYIKDSAYSKEVIANSTNASVRYIEAPYGLTIDDDAINFNCDLKNVTFIIDINGLTSTLNSLEYSLTTLSAGDYTVKIKCVDPSDETAQGLYSESLSFSLPLSIDRLAAPNNVTVNGATLSWSEIKGANAYEVYSNGKLISTQAGRIFDLNDIKVEGSYILTVRSINTENTALNSPLSKECLFIQENGAEGSESKPYQIETVEQLLKISDDMSASYKLLSDLNLSGIDWSPIGFTINGILPFTGSFDGNGHTITGLSIQGQYTFNGLFAKIDGGKVYDIIIDDASINLDSHIADTAENIGFICGYNSGIINKITINGSIEVNERNAVIGGVCGINNGEVNAVVINASFTMTALDDKQISSLIFGGISGENSNLIENAKYLGKILINAKDDNVSAASYVYNNNGKLILSDDTKTNIEIEVDATDSLLYVGGIVGTNSSADIAISGIQNIKINATANGSKTVIGGIAVNNVGTLRNINDIELIDVNIKGNALFEVGGIISTNNGYLLESEFKAISINLKSLVSPSGNNLISSIVAINNYIVKQVRVKSATTSVDNASTGAMAIGVLVAENNMSLENSSIVSSNIRYEGSGLAQIGGLAAKNNKKFTFAGSITNCEIASIQITSITPASLTVGGAVGANYGDISGATINSTISINNLNNAATLNIGGFSGLNVSTILAVNVICDMSVTSIGSRVNLGGFIANNNGIIAEATFKSSSIEYIEAEGANSDAILNIGAITAVSTKVLTEIESSENTLSANVNATKVFLSSVAAVNNGSISLIKAVNNSLTLTGTNNSHVIGGLAALNESNGTVESSFADTEIISHASGSFIGGLVATNYGKTKTSYSKITLKDVVGNTLIGGGIAHNYESGLVSDCYSINDIALTALAGNSKVSGFVGYSDNNNITNCYTGGNILLADGSELSGAVFTHSSSAFTNACALNMHCPINCINDTYAVQDYSDFSSFNALLDAQIWEKSYGYPTLIEAPSVTHASSVSYDNEISVDASQTTTNDINKLTNLKVTGGIFNSVLWKSNANDIVNVALNGTITYIDNGTTTISGVINKFDADGIQSLTTINVSITISGLVSLNGSGTETDPYLLSTANELTYISRKPDKVYKLLQHITVNDSFTPIGNPDAPFTGKIIGNNKLITIKNLNTDASYAGFIGYASGAVVENLYITYDQIFEYNSSLESEAYFGGLIGYCVDTTIKGCGVNMRKLSINAHNVTVGGLVGKFVETDSNLAISISKSYAKCEVVIDSTVAVVGLLLGSTNASVTTSYSSGIATLSSGNIIFGGLIGRAENGSSVNDAYSIPRIKYLSNDYKAVIIGGFLGLNCGQISSSYVSGYGNIFESHDNLTVGQFVGMTDTEATYTDVYCDEVMYGLKNHFGNSLEKVNILDTDYNATLATTFNDSVWTMKNGYPTLTGLVRQDSSMTPIETPILNSEGKLDVTNVDNIGMVLTMDYGYDVVFANMRWQSTILSNVYSLSINGDIIFKKVADNVRFAFIFPMTNTINYTNSYSLTAFTSGDGSETNPFVVKSQSELQRLYQFTDSYFTLGNDITLAGYHKAVGTSEKPFKGNFDGAGFTIYGLMIDVTDKYNGLFGYVDGGVIKNVNIDVVSITVNDNMTTVIDSFVGLLAGQIISGEISGVTVSKLNIDLTNQSSLGSGVVIGGITGSSTGSTIRNTVINKLNFITEEQSPSLLSATFNAVSGGEYTADNCVVKGLSYGEIDTDFYGGELNVTNSLRSRLAPLGFSDILSNQDLVIKYAPISTANYSLDDSGLLTIISGTDDFDFMCVAQVYIGLTNSYLEYTFKLNVVDYLGAIRFTSGNGTSSKPYVILAKEQLFIMNTISIPNVSSLYFKLDADIDLTDYSVPETEMNAHLDGDGHAIKNFNIERDATNSSIGLYSLVDGEISNVVFDNGSVTFSANLENVTTIENIGIICGTLSGKIENVSLIGGFAKADNTNYAYNIGSICGQISSSAFISNVTSTAVVLDNNATSSQRSNIGGLIGAVVNATLSINDADYKGTITVNTPTANVGGIIGLANGATTNEIPARIKLDGATINIQNTDGVYSVGGIIGDNNSINIDSVIAVGNINSAALSATGSSYFGGIVGINTARLMNAYAAISFNVSGNAYVGGIAGRTNNSFACISESTFATITIGKNGGIIGQLTEPEFVEADYIFAFCYYDSTGTKPSDAIADNNSITETYDKSYSNEGVTINVSWLTIYHMSGNATIREYTFAEETYVKERKYLENGERDTANEELIAVWDKWTLTPNSAPVLKAFE